MGEARQDLEREYCPPLDSALFQAIVSDHNLANDDELAAARQILDELKVGAEAEEASGFDPSGSSNNRDVTPGSRNRSPSNGTSVETSTTDMTSYFSAFTLEEGGNGYDKGIDAMPTEDKAALLKEMFADIKAYDVEHALKKQKGDFGAAFDILLSQKFLAEEADEDGLSYWSPRGVDGFAAEEGVRQGKKGRSNKKKNTAKMDLAPTMVDGSASSVNRWNMAQDDVKFIADRTTLSPKTVSSIYNASGHSLRATIISICKKSPAQDLGCGTDLNDALVQSNIVDLHSEFPSISLSFTANLVLLTHPLMASARELAQVVCASYQEKVVPQYVSTNLEAHTRYNEDEDEHSSYHSQSASLPVGSHYDALRSTAFAQASAAYRKSRSSPLMGGVAAYYAEIGHTANAALKRTRAIEANSRVAAQSSPNMCDLHGVTVADANRIAKQYVERWWSQRREWSREGSTMGMGDFRVVVGRGAHSSTGVGKLGPAVSKMLRTEGWRVDEQVGELIVRGRARK